MVFPTPVGVFLLTMGEVFVDLVFPTPVGVFLLSLGHINSIVSLPHARGGVSLSVA